MTSIRIIAMPDGEAPEHIRQAWIGLVLPLPANLTRPIRHSKFGVLTGPTNLFGFLFRRLFAEKQTSYCVFSKTAIEILDQHRPDAAQWWHENTPQYVTSTTRLLCFETEVCEIVS